ncbi:MAG: alpha-ribazole phosphatase [Prevotella sp.]
MEVIMIRHTSVDVAKGTCYGWTDVPVAQSFEKEATITKSQLESMTFDAVFSSPLTRARLLAGFCGFDNPVIDDRLKEINMGDWEMRMFDEIKDDNLQRWYDDYINCTPTNGESYMMLYKRVASFFDELKTKPYKRVAIFAHGGVLMCGGVYAGLFTIKDSIKHLVPFGCLQTIEI